MFEVNHCFREDERVSWGSGHVGDKGRAFGTEDLDADTGVSQVGASLKLNADSAVLEEVLARTGAVVGPTIDERVR